MTRRRFVLVVCLAVVAACLVMLFASAVASGDSSAIALLTTVLALLLVGVFAVLFETSRLRAREIAIIALLGTVSALLRVPFAAIPSLQPSTYLVICSGFVFGPVAGFMVGALTAVVSNFFLGHGPWTLFQVVAWGLAGATAPLLRRFGTRTSILIAFGVLWGILFGIITNLWTWVAFVYPLTLRSFAVTWANSIWFDALHALGNAFFLAALGVRTVRILERYHQRFNWVRAGDARSPDGGAALPEE
jgi:energy-coupling factor transport system substrate-specific component